MVKVLGIQEPYADTKQKKWGQPWENFLLESDKMLMENGEFLLFEKAGKIFFETDRLLFEDGFKIHLEAGGPEFLFWHQRSSSNPPFHVLNFPLLLENGFKIKIDYPYAHSSFGIYRLTNCREGKISTRRHFYNYNTDATPARLVLRHKYYAAVGAWRLLTSDQRAVYNKRAVGRHMSGYNLFIREFLIT